MRWRRKKDGRPYVDARSLGLGRMSLLTEEHIRTGYLVPTDEECDRLLEAMLAKLEPLTAGTPVPVRDYDIPRLCEWYETVYKASAPDSTKTTVRAVLARWQKWCAARELSDPMRFDSIAAQEYAGALLKDEHTVGGVKNYLAMVKSMYNAAVAVGLLKFCPVSHWPKMPKTTPRVHHYSPDQVREILAAVEKHSPSFYAIVLFLASTGWSVSDACDLRHSDIDLGRKSANRKRGKTGAPILLPLNSTALQAIEMTGTKTGHVFRRKNGKPMDAGYVWKALKRTKDAAKLPYRVNPHSFRHTVAVELTRRGTPLAVVAQILGHDPKTTLLYYQTYQPGSGAPYLDVWAQELDGTLERHPNVTPFRKSL